MSHLLLDNFFINLDIFESSCINFYYFYISDNLVFIMSTSMTYMFMTFFFLYFLKHTVIFYSYDNINFLFIKSFISALYDIVTSYFYYRYNIFFLIVVYISIFIFFNNFIGLIPFSNTINNHLNITGMISFTCWLGIIFIGLKFFGTRFFSMFCVSGIPRIFIPFLALIEILSYFFRFISLSLRLFANIVAGHILLETIYLFLFKTTLNTNNQTFFSLLFIFVPSILFIVLILFETVIACLQAYIFIVLFLIYLKDSLYLH